MLASLEYSANVARVTAASYERVKSVIPAIEWPTHAPYVAAINDLKKQRNAVVLAHNYQTPEIFHCVADISGDSLALAKRAVETDAEVIVLAGVHFMAETAKLLNPDKIVVIPDERAGCSLAESITAADVRQLRQKHPGVPVVTYVNTSAEVKAESDICCTSGNAVEIVESLGVDKVIFLPDEYLAAYVAQQTEVEIISWQGTRPGEIFHCVADISGDSLALAKRAVETDAEVIVLAGVHFMAETAKLLNPDKIVVIPDERAGCSLAESITAADVRQLRQKHPGVPVVTYVNTSAEVKAESDICCTSGNAVEIVESLGVDKVIFLPDEYLAAYVAQQTEVEIISWQGHCEVHERFTAQELEEYRRNYAQLTIIAHPECPPDVLSAADFVGSTAQMQNYVQTNRPTRVLMVTECSMSDNVAANITDVEFIRPCNLCPHMKRITLANIYQALETLEPRVEIDPSVAKRARIAVERMLSPGR